MFLALILNISFEGQTNMEDITELQDYSNITILHYMSLGLSSSMRSVSVVRCSFRPLNHYFLQKSFLVRKLLLSLQRRLLALSG